MAVGAAAWRRATDGNLQLWLEDSSCPRFDEDAYRRYLALLRETGLHPRGSQVWLIRAVIPCRPWSQHACLRLADAPGWPAC